MGICWVCLGAQVPHESGESQGGIFKGHCEERSNLVFRLQDCFALGTMLAMTGWTDYFASNDEAKSQLISPPSLPNDFH